MSSIIMRYGADCQIKISVFKVLQKGHYRLETFNFPVAAEVCGISASKVAGEASISRVGLVNLIRTKSMIPEKKVGWAKVHPTFF